MRVLIAEDEPMIGQHIARILESLGHEVVGIVADSQSGLALIRSFRPDLLLLDVDLEDGPTGPILAEEGAKANADVVFITAHADVAAATIEVPVLHKPFRTDDLSDHVEAVALRRAA